MKGRRPRSDWPTLQPATAKNERSTWEAMPLIWSAAGTLKLRIVKSVTAEVGSRAAVNKHLHVTWRGSNPGGAELGQFCTRS
jgi:hypothetical protein